MLIQALMKYNIFTVLLLTTPLSILLLFLNFQQWAYSGPYFFTVTQNRATVQFVIQIISTLLGLGQVLVVCRLINYATRIRLIHATVDLDQLRAWSDMSTPRMNWSLPLIHLVPLSLLMAFTLVPSALWAAALTPVVTATNHNLEVLVPDYTNSSLIKEYPSEIGGSGPSLRTKQGFFTYSVGIEMLGDLLSSAASATPIDGGERLHKKLDSTGFSFANRSYGVGAPVGLLDQSTLDNKVATSYAYNETGYMPNVECIYNKTSDFRLENTTNLWIYTAEGNLPDSNAGPEESSYIGHSMDSVVAIGVAHSYSRQEFLNSSEAGVENFWSNLTRYIAFAAGKNYDFLNSIQCSVGFVPMAYLVNVELSGRNITVQSLGDTVAQRNPDKHIFNDDIPSTVMRQFELIANDETNLYVSMVGKALNASISDYRMAQIALGNSSLDDDKLVLAGVTNSITAMVDDMLVAYASAQIMVANFTHVAPGILRTSAIMFGGKSYIIVQFLLNAIIAIVVIFEWCRTKNWYQLSWFDYTDLRHVAVAASAGGKDLGKTVYWSRDGREEASDLLIRGDKVRKNIIGSRTVKIDPSEEFVIVSLGATQRSVTE